MCNRSTVTARRRSSLHVVKTDVPEQPNLLRLFESYERHLRSADKSDSTVRNYRRAVEQFDEFLTFQRLPRNVRAITRDHVKSFMTYLLKDFSDKTASTRRMALVAFFKWCLAEDEIDASPMVGVPHIEPKKTPKLPIPDEDVKKLLHASKGSDFTAVRDNAIVWFFVTCGSRIGGASNLLAADVDLKNGIGTLRLKGGDKSVVHFSKKTITALDRYQRRRADHARASDPAFFIGRHGGLTTRGLYFIVQRLCDRAGVQRYNRHRFRNTSAIASLLAGIPEIAVMKQHGWSDHRSLRGYTDAKQDQITHTWYSDHSPFDRF